MMEVYAGYLSQTDYNVGRVLDAIDQLGQLDNTLVIYICGDNGASAEGLFQGRLQRDGHPQRHRGALPRCSSATRTTWARGRRHNHYPVGWAHAMCTPFQWAKQIASHYGGTRNGMVVSWPAQIKDKGGIRTQWHHVIDVVPTILEACGRGQPAVVNGVAQKPIEGVSMAYTFADAEGALHPPDAVLRDVRQPGHLPRRLDRLHHPAPGPLGGFDEQPRGGRDQRLPVGALPRRRGLQRGGQPGRPSSRPGSRRCSSSSTPRPPSTTSCRWTTARSPGSTSAIRPSLRRGRDEFTYYGGPVTRIPEGRRAQRQEQVLPHHRRRGPSRTGGGKGVVVTQGGLSAGWAPC